MPQRFNQSLQSNNNQSCNRKLQLKTNGTTLREIGGQIKIKILTINKVNNLLFQMVLIVMEIINSMILINSAMMEIN